MKKRTLVLSLVLSLALIFTSFATVFAGTGPATDKTKEEIKKSGIQCLQKIQQGKGEATAESIAIRLHDTTVEGGYNLIDTATLAKMVNDKEDVVIIDTMPQGWYDGRHIPGAICSIVGAMAGPEFKILPDEQTALLKAVNAAVGKKTYTYYWNGKKWTTKKPKTLKKCTKKKDKHYGKKSYKVKAVNKDKTIVVYCGFVGCERSHQGAMFLVKKGFKNVYRYPGGISGWVDAGYPIEGSDVAQ
ncbi:MAG: rhodanese-like domain-containing protein [Mogibacterium sp.]|nr:rhodanese-like domain-containing protein [Mogibacterium sp.]